MLGALPSRGADTMADVDTFYALGIDTATDTDADAGSYSYSDGADDKDSWCSST